MTVIRKVMFAFKIQAASKIHTWAGWADCYILALSLLQEPPN